MLPHILDLGLISASTGGPHQAGSGPSPQQITLFGAVGGTNRCMNNHLDVTAIQQALNRFSPEDGGPMTKLAVNGKFDAALSKAISRFQNKWDLFELKDQGEKAIEDGIVDKDGPTIDRLRAGPPTDFNGANELNRASKFLTATFFASTQAISVVQKTLQGGNSSSTPITDAMMAAFQRNFHAGTGKQAIAVANAVAKQIGNMQKAYRKLQSNPDLVQNDLPNYASNKIMRGVALSWGGGVHQSGKTHGSPPFQHHLTNTIYLTPVAKALDEIGIAYVLCHELGHYVDDKTIKDVYFARAPKDYERLSSSKAIHNADSYAQFMFDCAGYIKFNALKHIKY